MTKKILVLSYYFPPMGMGGTQRISKFCKYLPDFGWQPQVITIKSVRYYAQDDSLLNDLQNVPIYRTESLDPLRILAWWDEYRRPSSNSGTSRASNTGWKSQRGLKFLNDVLSGWLLLPDAKILWLPFALIQAWRIIRREKIQVLLTSSPPHSIHLAGFLLKYGCKIAWVADFRDEWTGGESQPEPTWLHRGINRGLEKLVLKTADHVIGIARQLIQNLQHKAGRSRTKFSVITNGFDAADFARREVIPQNKKFTLLHCGSVSKVSNPEPFFAALRALLDADHTLQHKMEVQFVGTDIFGQLPPLIQKYRLDDLVTISPYVPHQAAIDRILQAHVLLLFVSKKTKEEIITSKIFEYLAGGRPILAIIPDGELAQIMRQAQAGQIVAATDIPQIKAVISTYLIRFEQRQLPTRPGDSIAKFERRHLTRQLANICDDLFAQRSCGSA